MVLIVLFLIAAVWFGGATSGGTAAIVLLGVVGVAFWLDCRRIFRK